MNKSSFYIFIGSIVALSVFILFSIVEENKISLSGQQRNENVKTNEEKLESRESDEGNVTVVVTPEVLTIGERPRFQIEFNTHSVELDFEVSEVINIVDDEKNIYDKGIWDGTPPGGHHRSGTFTFDEELKETSKIRLILTEISGVNERIFEWKL